MSLLTDAGLDYSHCLLNMDYSYCLLNLDYALCVANIVKAVPTVYKVVPTREGLVLVTAANLTAVLHCGWYHLTAANVTAALHLRLVSRDCRKRDHSAVAGIG